MKESFEISGTLPGLNDLIGQALRNRYAYGDFKRSWTALVSVAAIQAKIPKIIEPIRLVIFWIEPNRRRDLDNIAGGGTKFILDGLVSAHILPNDTQHYVRSIEHRFLHPSKNNPRIIISLVSS